jgi:hypothetical protein
MLHHIILWKIKEEKTAEEKEAIKKAAKENLEGLTDKIPQIKKMHVQIESLSSSTADLMLDSEFESEADLKAYATNPQHVEVADTYIRPNMEVRMCLDYID